MTKVEGLRAALEGVRRGLGDHVFCHTTIEPIDPRISGDSHGDNPAAHCRTAQV